jgi:hypothetical protein
MSSSSGEGGYEVHNSTAIGRAFLQLQQQAVQEGRSEDLLRAARLVYDRLRHDPNEFGESLYRLPVLRLRVRCAVVRPLSVDFAGCEDRPLVFIKAVRLLAVR